MLALFHHRKRNDAHGVIIEFELEGGVLDARYMSTNDCHLCVCGNTPGVIVCFRPCSNHCRFGSFKGCELALGGRLVNIDVEAVNHERLVLL